MILPVMLINIFDEVPVSVQTLGLRALGVGTGFRDSRLRDSGLRDSGFRDSWFMGRWRKVKGFSV